MAVPVAIFTADHRHDVLKAMLYLYTKYWNWPATVYGFRRPNYALEDNIEFMSLGNMGDYPAEKWSDALIKALWEVQSEQIIILLEDYWLTRQVDTSAISLLSDYMRKHQDIVRADLTTDRLYGSDTTDVETLGRLDIIENIPPAPYHFSTQAGIWNVELLKGFLRPNETPWMAEMEGTNRMIKAYKDGKPARVIGTRQFPVRYLIAVQGGRVTLDGGYQKPAPVMREEDKKAALSIMRAANDNTSYAFAGVAQ